MTTPLSEAIVDAPSGASGGAGAAVIAADIVHRVGPSGPRWKLRIIPIATIAGIALIAPWIVPYDPTLVIGTPNSAPGGQFLFGTDANGLDVFSRTLVATRTDLLIGLFVMLISTAFGIVVGLLLGMNESRRGVVGVAARGIARAVDLLQAIPLTIAVLVVVSLYGTTVPTLVIAVAVLISPIQIRLTRAEVLRVRNDAYLDAARLAGQTEFELTVRHVLPNSIPAALENATVMFGAGILVTAGLGFLGIGLPPPTAEWGSMISASASQIMLGRWWAALFPAAALAVTVASVVFLSSAVVRHERT